MTTKLGFIGGGNMASALIGGLIKNDRVEAQNIFVFEPNDEQAAKLTDQFKIQLASNNENLIEQVDIVVLAIKPQVLRSVLRLLKESFKAKRPLIVSIVAGIRSASIENWLDGNYAVIRVMPNTPSLVGAGASGLYATKGVSDQQKVSAEELLGAVGEFAWVENEADIDAITALSGSGPAYFMLFINALIGAARARGLDSDTAKQLAVATAAGAAKLVASSDQSVQTLIDNVSSPNGTTEQALKSFNSNNLSGIVAEAFEAAHRRSEELADELGSD